MADEKLHAQISRRLFATSRSGMEKSVMYVYAVGDIVQLKKKHPCGSAEWEILRVGADFKLKCTGCGHEIMVPRTMVEKNTKNLKKACN